MLEEARLSGRNGRSAVEQDDAALEAYLGGEEPSEEVLKRCIRKARSAAVCPGAVWLRLQEQGCQPLLDAVVDYLPAPTDVARSTASKSASASRLVRRCSDDEPFAGLASRS